MSTILQRFLTDKCTTWRRAGEVDDYGQIPFGAPVVINCCYVEGGKLTTDNDGNQFMPIAEFDMQDAGLKVGDLIAFGAHPGTPESAPAHKIRKIVISTELRGARDVTVMTG
jgi:hypothetical protein